METFVLLSLVSLLVLYVGICEAWTYYTYKSKHAERRYALTLERGRIWEECHKANRAALQWERRAAALLRYSYHLEEGNPIANIFEGNIRRKLLHMDLAECAKEAVR